MLPNFLNSFTRQLGLSSSTPTSSPLPISDPQFQFLLEVLQATSESKGNPEVVYPLLQLNLDLLDDNFAPLLRNLATATLSTLEPDDAYNIAIIIGNFSNLIQQFPLGRRAINLEIAIIGYEVISTVFTREAFPLAWATNQFNLGLAYTDRSRGRRAENVELTIAAYNAALSVYTREAFPAEWAETQNNLGLAYTDRIKGDKAENIDLEIAAYNAALSVYTREAFPTDWATAQNNLGLAYFHRIRGEKSENIELAIAAYNAALSVCTREVFPDEWAETQINLGLAYTDRIRGDKAENIELAILAFNAALSVYNREVFPDEWAMTQVILGSTYRDRIRGERTDNIEGFLQACNAALSVYTREAFPTDWAGTQYNLGLAYTDRIRGERADNIEGAIAAYNAALSVYNREAFPCEWAKNQHNLGRAYTDRIRGERADNIERAIAAYNAALSVYNREAFPAKWAGTQNNLGTAYRDRIKEERAENLELAIRAYKAALLIYTREAFPADWAMTQVNLGAAYGNRIRGERAENLELALQACNAALSVYTREAFPNNWAKTQHNLAIEYISRIRGERAENLELAIQACNAALSVHTSEAFPTDWAGTQNTLGAAYKSRIRGERAENLELALQACNSALSVRTREAFPTDWAETQNNLGAAYNERIKGEKAENIEGAIAAFTAALTVYTREAFPYEWAAIQVNLGIVYRNRIRRERAENIELAISAYKAALSVFTREAFLQENVKTLLNLGLVYQESNQLPLAFDTFESAIETVEFLRDEIVSGDEIKQKLAEEWNQLYQRMVAVCLEMNRYTEAIEYVERSKARNLVELILSRDLHNLFPPEIARQLQQLHKEIAIGQNQLQTATVDNPTALAQHLKQLRQQRNELQDRYLRIGSRFKFDQFQATLDNRTAIIEWYITPDKFLAFILSPGTGGISVWQSTSDDLKALLDWDNIYRKDYNEQKENWRIQLPQRLEELAKILHLDELIEQLPKACNRLILIPHRFLHLFPLHALSLSHNGKQVCLLDLFPEGVSYAPSCQLLLQAQKRQRLNFTHLFAIQNPTNDLTYTDLEVQALADYFHSVDILKQEKATLAAINDANLNAIHCAHFSCHGYFNLNNPRKSALILADAPVAVTPAKPNAERYLILRDSEVHDLDNCLTLDAILSLNLEQCRLVTLSACESGLIDFNNTSDEYIGLPNGFLVAGSPAVVSSLWTVNDLSTALLTIRFYKNLKSGLTPALALNQAQFWLRNATKEELQQWTNSLNLDATERRPLRRFFRDMEAGAQPFASPYYWAAFCAIGQ